MTFSYEKSLHTIEIQDGPQHRYELNSKPNVDNATAIHRRLLY